MGDFIERDGTRIHYLHHAGPEPAIILLHGLTANAHCFGGLVREGLCARRGGLAMDLRGRGRSDKPATGYSMAEHAADVIALLDHWGLARAVLCGHSYGALLTLYIATAYPERVSRIVLMDVAGPTIHNSQVFELLKPSLDRLGMTMESMGAFLDFMRGAPFLDGYWSEELVEFYRADVEELADGQVRVRISPESIAEVVAEARHVNWPTRLAEVSQPTLLLHASGPYGPPGTPPLILEEQAREAVEKIPDCRYVHVPGNHLTMLFDEGARAVVAAIDAFLT